LNQVSERTARLENEYTRAVSWDGNIKAQEVMSKTFKVTGGNWRGLGRLPDSALQLREEYLPYDARRKFDVKVKYGRDLLPGCQCHLVMIGKIRPTECPLFMKACIPQKPMGACMVSIEGTCRIWANVSKSI